ncbi:MAG: hypothetical protein HPY51_06825 [Candidatus Omnitrophica bacterium]|nr:hypothetical protein [Candidatus Omnitrophota bacterium]
MRSIIGILVIAALSLGSLSPPAFSQTEFLSKDILNLEAVRQEEHLSENSQLSILYIFLAVRNHPGENFTIYYTRIDQDLDNDGKTVLDEPNDLAEYQKSNVSFQKDIQIPGGERTCYITALPHFSDLYPKERDPFKYNTVVEVLTRAAQDNPNRLVGSTSFPLINAYGVTAGIERYTVFYNKSSENGENGEVVFVSSYGIILMGITEPAK